MRFILLYNKINKRNIFTISMTMNKEKDSKLEYQMNIIKRAELFRTHIIKFNQNDGMIDIFRHQK